MSKLFFNRSVPFLAVLAVCLLLAGCGGKISMANYDKVQNGMTQQEVESILGKGVEQASSGTSIPSMGVGNVSVPGISMSGKSMVWKDGNHVISVMLLNGKVISKAQIGL